ncbi:MAG: hypothetical protein ACFFFG_18740, partial [Candidatus Thorarchaeota archaeon]
LDQLNLDPKWIKQIPYDDVFQNTSGTLLIDTTNMGLAIMLYDWWRKKHTFHTINQPSHEEKED